MVQNTPNNLLLHLANKTTMETTKEFNFSDTSATKKIFGLKKRLKAVCGGTSASKTISILVWLIDYSQSHDNKKVDVMSESYPHLEDGAIKDFRSIMLDRGYWRDELWNSTKHTYAFETGTVLKFISIDKLGKAHGPRRDVLFVNEANHIPYNIFDQLKVRTKDHIWLDWNPTIEFWYYTEVAGKLDHDFLTLTYLDCLDVLDENIIEDIESHKTNKQWWQVYGLGQLGEVEGRIYTGWQIIDRVPDEAKLERRGLDFGYTNDPSAMIDIYKYNDCFVLDEQIYQKGLSNKQIADIINNLNEKALVIADSAEPKSIDELKLYGVSAIGAKKGKDSVNNGIQHMQEQKIMITKRSVRTIKEYRNYFWLVDKDGNSINKPADVWNHAMDAIRYAMSTLRVPYTGKKVSDFDRRMKLKKKKQGKGYSLRSA